MTSGYFFIGIKYSSEGAAFAQVEIRPLASRALQQAGARIDISIPIRTTDCDLSVAQVAAQALQAAQALLPETALQAWWAQYAGEPMPQPCLPGQALQEWLNP